MWQLRQLITGARTSRQRLGTVRIAGFLRMVLAIGGQGLFLELLLRKDGGMMVGCIKDMGACVDMEVRVCTGGGQSWKWGCSTGCGTGQDWVLYAKEAGSGIHGTCIYVWVWVQGLGRRQVVVHGAAGKGGFCYHGTELCWGGGSLDGTDAMVYTEAFKV